MKQARAYKLTSGLHREVRRVVDALKPSQREGNIPANYDAGRRCNAVAKPDQEHQVSFRLREMHHDSTAGALLGVILITDKSATIGPG